MSALDASWGGEDDVTIRWRGVCWFELLLLSCLAGSESAVIGSYFPISRSQANTYCFPPSGFVSLRFSSCSG